MTESHMTAQQAESFVDQLIEQFGYGAYPKVTVSASADGTWVIGWRGMSATKPPMTSQQWQDWLRTKVGSITPERLETSEG